MADYDTLLQQTERLSCDFKEFYLKFMSALNDVSIQLKSLKLAQQADKDGATNTPPKTIDDKQPQRTWGYINWNTTHDFLKTESWMKMSVFTQYCGKLERGFASGCYLNITNDDKRVVDEESRFPEDGVYVNVNNPLVGTEILYIKELRATKPVLGLMERFLSVAKDEMHTYSSFEKKYGLKWVNRIPEASNVVENTINSSASLDAWCSEDTKNAEVNSDRKKTNESLSIDEPVEQELSNKFTDILDKLTLTNLNYSVGKVLSFPINDQKRMEAIVNLLFEKALEKPNSSFLYATLASKLSHLKVPSDSDPDSYVNFRGMIIQKCQVQFQSDVQIEKELAENNDHDIEDELQMKMDERKTIINSNRAVANAKFIGQMYNSRMLTSKIVNYCLENLSGELEEVKIKCLCEILATAGKQLQFESNIIDEIFDNLQDIINLKYDQISSSTKLIIQNVIDLRKRWMIAKNRTKSRSIQQY